MNFGEALQALWFGKRVARSGWNGKGMWIELQLPSTNSKMTLPYIFIVTPGAFTTQGHMVPWLASQTDLLVEDWEVVT